MKKTKTQKGYFSTFEILLWSFSILFIVVSYAVFDRSNVFSLVSSIIGITALIFVAKGNPVGQIIMVIFCIMYGIISYSFAYYGEVITYLGMSLPMAVCALVSWLKNPYNSNKSEVKINVITKREIYFMLALSLVVTVAFYFILKYFNTANLIPSTISVLTSFAAAYLLFRRSPYFALAYALNDIVLIVLWTLATLTDVSYVSVVVCFIVFLANDLYSFFNWQRMQKKQLRGE